MGVVRERKAVACTENDEIVTDINQHPGEAQSESEDDIEPIIIIPSRHVCRRTKIKYDDDLSVIKNNTGKRKHRRYLNSKLFQCITCISLNFNIERLLENLPKDKDDQDNLIEGPFIRLMESTDDAIQYLNDFCDKLESAHAKNVQRKCFNIPVLRISHKIRRAMKLRKSFPSDKHKEVEGEILDFFMKTPKDVFNKMPMNRFERLFLHAIAQYHDLQSINFFLDDFLAVEIRNMKDVWIPIECNLCDFFEKDF